MARARRETWTWEPLPFATADLAPRPRPTETRRPVRRIGRLRVPLAGAYRPWANLYRLPDSRTIAILRLWEGDRPVRRVVPVDALVRYAERSQLPALLDELRNLTRPEGA